MDILILMLTICVVVFMLLVVVRLIFSYCGMDKIDFKEVGTNNIDKYIGKECKIAGKKYIIVRYTIDYPYLFLLLLIQKMECGMMTMLK